MAFVVPAIASAIGAVGSAAATGIGALGSAAATGLTAAGSSMSLGTLLQGGVSALSMMQSMGRRMRRTPRPASSLPMAACARR